jgi:hypothetical protein
LVEWNILDIAEQELLSGLHDEAEVYGIFKPVSSSANQNQKVAYKEVALLYLHLAGTNSLPRYLNLSEENKTQATIAQLVLDGILEIESGENFVSGTAAVGTIFGEDFAGGASIPDRLTTLSLRAMQYGLLLGGLDLPCLSHRLYTYNTIPWDGFKRLLFYAEYPVPKYLFSAAPDEISNLLRKHWEPDNLLEVKYWLSWSRPIADPKYFIKSEKATFKLYISPLIDDLPKVFRLAIPILSASAAFCFKAGATVQGLLRPDKMVVYFENKEELMETATLLKNALCDCQPQGVPFTTQLDEGGMLSWAVDPTSPDLLSIIKGGGWRLKVTNHLALAIIQSQKEQFDMQKAMLFIKAKLLSVGINPQDWTVVNHLEELSS